MVGPRTMVGLRTTLTLLIFQSQFINKYEHTVNIMGLSKLTEVNQS